MSISREKIESIVEQLWDNIASENWQAWCELFSEDCTWTNSLLDEPIKGREALCKIAVTWGVVNNIREWVAIDGNRLVVAWRERVGENPGNAPWYTGVSSYLFNEEGTIQDYEGTFDVQSVMASINYKE